MNNKNNNFKPVIVMVGTQLSHNIGSAARAMLNFGLNELRLVNPVLGNAWYDKNAISLSAGAEVVLNNVKMFSSTKDAIADLNLVLSTSRRRRDMTKPITNPEHGCNEIVKAGEKGRKSGILFGCEKSGLDNEDISVSDMVVEIPVNPDFASLNLSQAVLLLAYEWNMAKNRKLKKNIANDIILNVPSNTTAANKKDMEGFFNYLTKELNEKGFFDVQERREATYLKLRNLFYRMIMTKRELKTMWSIIKLLQK